MMRLFAGLDISSEIAASLANLEGGIPGARWIAPENHHVTLVFIGEVPEHVADEIDETLADIDHPALDLSVEGLGTFGHAKPHTLWAGIADSPGLNHLQAKVTQALRDLGIEIERRKFFPHVTLARLKDAPADRLRTFIAGNSPFHAGTFHVPAFTLFQSFVTKDGSDYRRLMEYPLNSRLAAPGITSGSDE